MKEKLARLSQVASCLAEASMEMSTAVERYLRGLKSLPKDSEKRAREMVELALKIWDEKLPIEPINKDEELKAEKTLAVNRRIN